MRRLLGLGVGCWLLGVPWGSVAAQRPPARPAITLEEPRPTPVLPAALVPFAIASEVCKNGHVPIVALKVYNVLAQPVATLRLRNRRAGLLDGLKLRCGSYVATWNGTVEDGGRAAPPGIYYVQLLVDDRRATRKLIVPQP